MGNATLQYYSKIKSNHAFLFICFFVFLITSCQSSRRITRIKFSNKVQQISRVEASSPGSNQTDPSQPPLEINVLPAPPELSPSLSYAPVETELVDENEIRRIKTELAWMDPTFSSQTPLNLEDLEELSDEIDRDISPSPIDNQKDLNLMEASLLKEGIEHNFILCSGSIYKKDWETEFEKTWKQDNKHYYKRYNHLIKAMGEAKSKSFIELVYPNVGDTVYDYPMIINKKVIDWIHYFRTRGRKNFITWLRRGSEIIPMMRSTLKQNGLPQDLVYLSMIESGFSSRALSHAGALGPWQFMPGTALRYGLKINDYVDERKDPNKASRSAAAYLSYLYNMFGDWHLAAASYNAGEGRVQKALRKFPRIRSHFATLSTEEPEHSSFFHLAQERRIPNETRNYVPKMIAAMIISKNPEKFGFDLAKSQPQKGYKVVPLTRSIHLQDLAFAMKEPKEVFDKLNPELRFGITPPPEMLEAGYYELKVPEHLHDDVLQVIDSLPASPAIRKIAALVSRKDTIESFARKNGIATDFILKNHPQYKKNSRLNPGQVVFISIPLGSGKYAKLLKQKQFMDYEHYVIRGSFSKKPRKRARSEGKQDAPPRATIENY